MSYGGDYDYQSDDYYNGRISQIEDQQAETAATNVSAAPGTSGQVVGYDSAGNPIAISVVGDTADGFGLSANSTALTLTAPQNLQTTATPTFDGVVFGAGLTTLKRITTGTVSVDPGSIAAQTRGSVSVTVTGTAVGDIIVLEPPSTLEGGLAYAGCEITGANTVRVDIANISAGAIDGASLSWKYRFIDIT